MGVSSAQLQESSPSSNYILNSYNTMRHHLWGFSWAADQELSSPLNWLIVLTQGYSYLADHMARQVHLAAQDRAMLW
jgi:hypothetical protein